MISTRSLRGFTLTEMIVILGLFSIAGLIGSRLFAASMRVIGSAPAAQDQQVSLERMAVVLREDAWGAKEIQVSNEHSVTLIPSQNQAIHWQFTDTAAIRTSGEVERHWNIRAPIAAHLDRASLVLLISPTRRDMADERRFVSQFLTSAAEAKP
jgi:type II secretory pathway component PulJ